MEQVTTPLKVNILRKPIKHIYLRLRSADELEVSAPKRCPQKFIDELIAERHDWITQRREQLRDTARSPSVPLLSTERVLLAGHWYVCQPCRRAKEAGPEADSALFNVTVLGDKGLTEQHVERQLRRYLSERITALLTYWEPLMGVKASCFGIRKMHTRWGTCNTRTEKIWLSFQLVHFPLELLEYVVVHELTHLFERYHNRRFYALMDSFLPNWRSLKQRLNHYEIPDYPSGQ